MLNAEQIEKLKIALVDFEEDIRFQDRWATDIGL